MPIVGLLARASSSGRMRLVLTSAPAYAVDSMVLINQNTIISGLPGCLHNMTLWSAHRDFLLESIAHAYLLSR